MARKPKINGDVAAHPAIPNPVDVAKFETSSGPLKATAGLLDGTDGTPSMTWARYPVQSPADYGFYGGSAIAIGGKYGREAPLAASIASDLQISNPVVATIAETMELYAVGTGLTLSSRPNLEKYGVSKEDIRKLSHDIETLWEGYSTNPREVDFTGRFDLHMLAATAFRSYEIAGEYVVTFDFAMTPGGKFRTKVSLLDALQLDRSRTMMRDGLRSINGVAFSTQGRVVGYWLRQIAMGDTVGQPQSKLVPAVTTWGRPKVLHQFEAKDPRQVRGMSPIAPALTPAHARETLGEFALAAAYIQTSFSMTVESDFPPQVAFQGLHVDDAEGGMAAFLSQRKDWYTSARITPKPGVVHHLAPGDKMKFNRSETPNNTYGDFDKSLARRAARAAGLTYEDVSGDYSQTSFSASRMATDAPWRLTLKRRRNIVEPFYKATFRCWLEEAIETGQIKLPENAPPFWQDPEAYTRAKWLGSARPEPDRAKLAMAQERELANGTLSLTDALAERGIDFETHFEQLQEEKEYLEKIGLKHPYWSEKVRATQITVESQNDD